MCIGNVLDRAQDPVFKRLLVAVDESEQAGFACDVASHLAWDLGARLVLVHVVAMADIRPDLAFDPDIPKHRLQSGQNLLEEFKLRVGAGVPVEVVLREGTPCAEILDVAKYFSPDLIVLGTHGRGRIAEVLMGSVAHTVTRKANCPVMTVAHATAAAACSKKGTPTHVIVSEIAGVTSAAP